MIRLALAGALLGFLAALVGYCVVGMGSSGPAPVAHAFGEAKLPVGLAAMAPAWTVPEGEVEASVDAPLETPRTRPFRVVLDPGHGGSNTGCAGVVDGLYEKRFTLLLTREIEARLEAAGVDVELTRDDDTFLTLRERASRANAIDADLFVSVHGNASPTRGQRGFETYLLSPEALAVDARALRQDDTAAGPVAGILEDAARGAAQVGSARLAQSIQNRLAIVRPDSPNRGIKQASMDGLLGPLMPAVLVEVGFLDHPVEGLELLRSDVRAALADAIAQGILDQRPSDGARPERGAPR